MLTEAELQKKWESLTFTDDFIFSRVMHDEHICRQVVELILGVRIGEKFSPGFLGAGAGKSTLEKKFESTRMTILSYDEESFKRGLKEHPLPQEVLEDIKTYLDEKLISLIKQNIDIVLDYSFWSREMNIFHY